MSMEQSGPGLPNYPYQLVCPECGEDTVYIHASDPKSPPYCSECENDIDLDTVIEKLNAFKGWVAYFRDIGKDVVDVR